MPRPKVSSEGKSPTASQNESGATTTGPMSELLTVMTNKFEEVNMEFEEINKHLVDKTNASKAYVRSGSPAIVTLFSPQVEEQWILHLEIKLHH